MAIETGLQAITGQVDEDLFIERLDTDFIDLFICQLGEKVYISLDLDGLDPSIIPATGTPVPGGLGWYDLLYLLKSVGEQRQVVACDVVELAPIPGLHAADFAAAQLVYKMIGYFVRS